MRPQIIFVLSVVLGFHPLLWSQALDPYANSPSWYRPGHPLQAAKDDSISTLPGFKVETVLNFPEGAGSLTTMTVDAKGNLLVATQHQAGIYRVVPSTIGSGQSAELVPLSGVAAEFGWCQGLLYAFDSLYVTVSETNEHWSNGLYRLMDADLDGEYDQVFRLLELKGAGEHGPHNMVVGPEGDKLYMICGNGTPVPESIKVRRTVRTSGYDHLLPDGFESSEYTDGGWVMRLDPDGSNPELLAGGLRNSYDLAFNNRGDLFTFDSDMEYDLGTSWYRPTRICQLVSGADFGWRAGAAKWPEYYEDSVHPVVNVGPSSPTGVIFGYKTSFPEKYRNALFALDWTFATIYAVHLQPKGAGYTADFEIFASGTGLPVTDVVSGTDGALYFSVGGRKLGSAIYRIWYDGPEERTQSVESDGYADESRDLRLSLESYHGRQNPSVVDKVWTHLGSEDHSIRYAARIALEAQPVAQWRDRVLQEKVWQIKFPALLALARQGSQADLLRVLDALESVDVSALSDEGVLLVLRIYERLLGRGEKDLKDLAAGHSGRLLKLLPSGSKLVNRELARVLCCMQETAVIDPLLELMASDEGDKTIVGADLVERNLRYGSPVLAMIEAAPLVERMHHAQMLTWLKSGWDMDQRQRFLQLVVEAIETSKGGNGYLVAWNQILDLAKSSLSADEQKTLSPLWAELDKVEPLPVPQGPGRIWEMDYLLQKIESESGPRDFENGKKMYAAAQCITCHVMMSDGGITGPNLTSVGQRFTVRDVLDSILHPSNAISDQYQLMTFSLKNGEMVSGRVHSKDSQKTTIAPNVTKPSQLRTISNSEIKEVTPLPVSTMPPGLLTALNEDEVLDLIAYLMAGGQPEHAVFK
jgi:putative heme-binding domain-containing protein